MFLNILFWNTLLISLQCCIVVLPFALTVSSYKTFRFFLEFAVTHSSLYAFGLISQ